MSNKGDQKEQRFETLVNDNLKRIYSDLVQEELPDRFKVLLSQLKEQEQQKSSEK